MSKKNQHVVPHSGGWAVKAEKTVKVSSVHPTQKAAESAARQSAMRTGSEVFIHGRDGRIRERNTYGRDPFPPKG